MPRRPAPLPSGLASVFSLADAERLAVPRSRLDRQDLRSPYPGLRATADAAPPVDLRTRCEEYAPRLRAWQFFSHDTALALVGAPMPEWPYVPSLHISAHRPAREPRLAGVIGHRLQVRETAVSQQGVLPVEDPVRAWRQAGTLWRLDDLIAAADFLISGSAPLATLDDLRVEVETMGDVRRGILRRALADARSGPRSARETHLRLAIVRAGLPEPEINWILRDQRGVRVAEIDLAFPRYKVAAEYDGRVHETDPKQFAKDSDRWDRIRAQGWDHVRVLNHHMKPRPTAAIRKVRDALIRAGWTPGASSMSHFSPQ